MKITTVKKVWIPGLNKRRFRRFYFSVYSLVFVSIEKIYQTLETAFHRLSKHLEFGQKYSAARRIFNSLLGVWISRWNTVSRVWYITWRPPCIHGAFVELCDWLKRRTTHTPTNRHVDHNLACWYIPAIFLLKATLLLTGKMVLSQHYSFTMIVFVNWVRFVFRANKWFQFYNRVTQSFHTPSEGWVLKTKTNKTKTKIGIIDCNYPSIACICNYHVALTLPSFT